MAVTSTGIRKRKVVEHAVFFQLRANTNGKVKEDMVQGLADLKELCPKWVIAESAGTNFCARDQRYTHGVVVRCPSLKDLKHSCYIDVMTKTVWPIAEKLLSPDYVVDRSGRRISSL